MAPGKVVFPRARRLPFMKMHRERARTAMGKTNIRDNPSPGGPPEPMLLPDGPPNLETCDLESAVMNHGWLSERQDECV